MRRIWAAVCTAFAVVAVFAVLAVTHSQPPSSASGVGPGVHATTQTSPVSGGSLVQSVNGPAQVGSHPTTRSS